MSTPEKPSKSATQHQQTRVQAAAAALRASATGDKPYGEVLAATEKGYGHGETILDALYEHGLIKTTETETVIAPDKERSEVPAPRGKISITEKGRARLDAYETGQQE